MVGRPAARDRRILAGLSALHRRVQAREHRSIVGLVHDLLALTGYLADRLQAGDETAVLNVAQFTRLAAAFDRHGHSRSTYRFGEYLRSLPERALDERRPPVDDAVQVMTIHQAKGLEFPVVIVASVIEGRLPTRERQRRLLVADDLAPQVMPPEIAARPRVIEPETHLPDQRRLFYVALTRACDLLIVSAPERVRRQRCRPSRFLAEMGLAPTASRPIGQPVESTAGKASTVPRLLLSFSAVSAYLTCPLQYRLLYEEGLAAPTWYVVQAGASLHRTLEAIHRRALRGEPVDEATALALFEAHWVSLGACPVETERQLKETGRRDLAHYAREHAASFSRIRHVELPFWVDAGGVLLSGRIDLVRVAEDGGLEIVDFKTRMDGGHRPTRADLQLRLYALAGETLLEGQVRHLTVHLLAEGRVACFTWDPPTRQRVRVALEEVVAGVTSRRFPPRPGPPCRVCPFRRLCPYSARAAHGEYTEA